MSQPIVLFGGTFDPVHHAHLIVARAVAEQCGFERITLVPAASPPHKPAARADAPHRLAMLRAAIEGEELFAIDEIELGREGPSYTIDTIRALRERGGDVPVTLLVGADMLEELPRWHEARQVVESARILVVGRPPWDRRMERIAEEIAGAFGEPVARRLREDFVPAPLLEISSTDIRRRVADGRSIRYLVPERVGAYINEKGLYARG